MPEKDAALIGENRRFLERSIRRFLPGNRWERDTIRRGEERRGEKEGLFFSAQQTFFMRPDRDLRP
jgi:hypothetical protein